MNSLAEIKSLSIAFEKGRDSLKAVRGVDFRLKSGETLALLGESGCGKSITSLGMMRLLPPEAAFGKLSEVRLKNEDLLALPEWLMQTVRGKRIAMIFQEPMTALNPVLSIGQQLGECLKHHHLSRKAVQSRMIELLTEVEMPEPELRLNQYPHQLSGGQKQRVVIAMALASEPEILIADEPTTALDVTIQAQILKLLKKIQQSHQTSLLLITHDLAVVKAMADRVCVMYAGQIVEQADAGDFFSEVKHPYVQQLLASLPCSESREKKLSVIAGTVPSLDAIPSGCSFHPRCPYAFERCRTQEPAIQNQGTREVRCHLYPEHQHLPALNVAELGRWEAKPLSSELLLSVQHLKVYFEQRHGALGLKKEQIKAVDDLSFDIKKGRTLAMVGESGCGKTTASRAIMQLIPMTEGEIVFQGQLLTGLSSKGMKSFRQQVQLIFQDPFSSMNPRMTVAEILAEGMRAQRFSRKRIEQRTKELLEQVHLPTNSLSRYPHQFSGGQRQRIAIARALAGSPELLICDEPTSALDISVQAQILNLLKELQQEQGLSYLFITHNMSVVSYMADEVLVMQGGKAVEYGSVEQVLYHPKEVYTKQLLSAVLTVE